MEKKFVVCKCGIGHFNGAHQELLEDHLGSFRKRVESMPYSYRERSGEIEVSGGVVVGCTCSGDPCAESRRERIPKILGVKEQA